MDSFKKVTKQDQARICNKIDSLAEEPWPSGVVKMKGTKQAFYRIRCGSYRIVYQVKDNNLQILVVDVEDRKEVCHSY